MSDGCALLFPGQGVQRPALGVPWRGTPAWSRVGEISQASGVDVEALLLDADEEALRATEAAQLVVFAASMLALAAARDAGATGCEVACAGHSVGEYSALVAAGALSLREGAALICARGRAMAEASRGPAGTMIVLVGQEAELAHGLCARLRAGGCDVWVANVNAPTQVVLSGTPQAIAHAARLASGRGLKAIAIPVSGAFHSPLMAPAGDKLRRALAAASFTPTSIPVVANVDARPHVGVVDWPALELRQLTEPVRWAESIGVLRDELGCRRLLEIGPGRTLAGLARRIDPDAEVHALDSPASIARVATLSLITTQEGICPSSRAPGSTRKNSVAPSRRCSTSTRPS